MMITLTLQEQKVVEKLLVERPKRRKANKTLFRLAEQGFGALTANNIITYSQTDFAYIATIIDKQNISDDKIQLTQLTPTSNRLEVAQYRTDEKWSQAKVFAQQVLIVGMDCSVPLLKPISNESVSHTAQNNLGHYV